MDFNLVPAEESPQYNLVPAEQVLPTPKDNVVAGSFGNPDAAAKSINLSQKTGVPASVINLDPDWQQKELDRKQAVAAVQKNPAVAKFAEKPVNAEAATGTYSELDEASDHFKKLDRDRINSKATTGLMKEVPGLSDLAESGPGQSMLEKALSYFTGDIGAALPEAHADIRNTWEGHLVQGLYNLPEQLIKGSEKSLMTGVYDPSGPMNAALLTMGKTPFARGFKISAGPTEEPGYVSFDDFMHHLAGMRTRAEIDEFLAQASGAKEGSATVRPVLQITKAKVAEEALEQNVEAAQGNPLKERSVQAFEEFLESHESPGRVNISGETILDLYSKAGKMPATGDGLLGFVAGILEKAKEAASTGTEVSIPFSKYVANIDPTVHEKLRPFLRLHDDGVTPAEAEVLQKIEPHSEIHPAVVDHLATIQPEAFNFERITSAANKYGENIYSGQLHSDAMEKAEAAGEDLTKHTPDNEGFLTSSDRFVDREEAFKIAHRADQGIVRDLDIPPDQPPQLLAEDIVPPDEREGPTSLIEKEAAAEDAVEAAKKAEAAKAEAGVKPEGEEELKATPKAEEPTEVRKAEDLAPAKEDIKARAKTNAKRLAQLLGPKLYGDPTDMDQVAIKEMLQNSFDSIKGLIEEGRIKNPQIDIKFDEKKRAITIKDNGAGMTAETLAGPFLEIAGTLKETQNKSGGFGIAKMLYLYANKELRVVTMRDGKVSTLVATGEQIYNSLEENGPPLNINRSLPTKEHKALFPDGHGTQVEIVLPESFKDPSTGEQKAIEFRSDPYWHEAIRKSPLFHDIKVNWDSGRKYQTEQVEIGKDFPYHDFTQFVNVNFDWGKARIYVSKSDVKMSSWDKNVHVLSNGIYQFGTMLKKNPNEPYGENVPKELYIDVDSKATPTDPGYPFDLNRQGFTKHAKDDLDKIMNFISNLHQQEDFATAVKNFGDIQYYDEAGKPGESVKLAPKIPEKPTALSEIKGGEQVDVKDGRLFVKGREIRELSKADLAASKIDFAGLMMDQKDINPSKVMLHDNIEILTEGGDYISLIEAARDKFGARFDTYSFGVGDKYKELRDVVADVMDYPDLAKEAVGVSFDKEYRGVSIKVPFSGMFLNVAVPRYTDPIRAATGMVGTMIHEFAHHKVRSHNADFPAEMQDIIIALDALEHLEGQRATLTEPYFSLVKFKEEVIALVKQHEDVLKWLNETITAEGLSPEGQPLVRNRGKRFKESGDRQAADVGVSGGAKEPTEAVQGGYEGLRPAFQPIEGGEGPAGVPESDRPRTELDKLSAKVADNPLATKAAVTGKKARHELYLDPLLTKGKTLNIDQSMYRLYSNLIEKANIELLEKAIAVTKKIIERRASAAWKAEEDQMRPGVEAEILARPEWLADRYFNWDKGMLPSGKRIISDKFEEMGEAKADEWAPVFDFESGSEMTSAVLKLEQERADAGKGPKWQLKQHVNAEIERRMEDKYGSLKDNIEMEASGWGLISRNVDVLNQELKMLAAASGKSPLTRDDLQKWVHDQFIKQEAGEVTYERWRRAAEKGGKDAEKALLKDDITSAFNAKQRQALALLLAKEAKGFEKEMDRFNSMISRIQKTQVLSGVDQRYTDQLHRLIDKMGYKNPRSPNELASALMDKPLNEFVADRLGEGAEMPVADFMLSKDWTADTDKLSVEDFRAVSDSIATILHNGQLAKKITVGNQKKDYDQTIAEGLNQVADVDPKVVGREPGLLNDLRSNLRNFDAMMLKMEQMLRWMDKRDKFGVFSQAGFRPVVEAKHVKNDLLKEMGNDIKALPEVKGVNKSIKMFEDTGNRGPKYPSIVDWQNGESMVLSRKHMLMMMLHSGNESNYGKLTSKYNYNNKDYQWTAADIDNLIKDNATKADWDYVQGWWNIFDKYWPRVEELSRKMSGIAPDKIEPRTITTPFGDYKGGYIPVGADKLWPGLRSVDRGVFNAQRYFNATPPKRYTLARTGASYPVSLAFDSLTDTMYQMAHDLAFREPLSNAAKFLDNTEIRGAIQRVLGPEYLAQVRPWLEFQASAKQISDESVGALDSLARTARHRIVTVQMLYRASTILKHGAAAAMYSVGEVGLRDMASESIRLWMTHDGRERVRQIMQESGELRNRLHDIDRDMGEMQDRSLGESGFKAGFYHWGMQGTSAFDIGTAIPTYEVALKRYLVEHPNAPYEDAIYAGEAAVRDAHGSSGVTDQAAILRAGPMYKLFTIAYGTFNHNYNRTRDIGKLLKESAQDTYAGNTGQAWEKFKTAAWRGLWYIFITAAIEEWIAPIADKKGEKHGMLAWGGRALFEQLSGQIPIIREVAKAWLHKGRPEEQTPMGQVIGSIYDASKAIAAGDFTKRMALRKTAEGLGYALPIPGAGQLGTSIQYLEDIKMRRQMSTAEMIRAKESPIYRHTRGFLLGKSHPEKK